MQTISDSTSGVFDAAECLRRLSADLRGAIGRILIASPFATVQGVTRCRPHFESAVKRGVSVCAIIQEPPDWQHRLDGSLKAESVARLKVFEAAIELLQSIGVHVTLRPKMHEKIIVIDDRILWEGSINFLSWYDTSERTRRWESHAEVVAALDKHQLLPCSACVAPPLSLQIAHRRISLGLTQEKLARLAGTHRKIIGRIESGDYDVRITTFLQICDALGLELLLVPGYLAPAIHRMIQSRDTMY